MSGSTRDDCRPRESRDVSAGLRLVARLRREIRRTAGPLVGRSRRVALVDFPDYANVGDSAIWLGELEFLRAMGVRKPAYVCDQDTFDAEELRARVGRGPILLSGGGNLGDLYPRHQRFREEILRSFPNNPVVQLPQSIWFESREALDRARKVFDGHPRFTLLLRDRASLQRARREFDVRSVLCPDMAFALGRLQREGRAERDHLWLLRTGPEAAERSISPPHGAWQTDWAFRGPSLLARLHRLLHSLAPPSGRFGHGVLCRAIHLTYGPLARSRLRRGIRLLSRARQVTTDRLHGHILCLLVGIPHRVLDNSNGKVGAFYRTWTSDSELAEWAGAVSPDGSDRAGPPGTGERPAVGP